MVVLRPVRRSISTLIALTAAFITPALSAQSPADPSALAARVQEHYASVRDFSGDFVQTYEGGVLRTRTSERGTVAIKRPGRMKWLYTKPEQKEFVSDGNRLYTYLVADRQVIVSPAPGPDDGTTPALFLVGRTDLAKDFVASFMALPDAGPGLIGLKLVAKVHDPDYEWIAVGVDPSSFQIQYLVAADRQGGRSAFAFSNLKENRGLTDKDFEFHMPRGVDVITNGTRSQ